MRLKPLPEYPADANQCLEWVTKNRKAIESIIAKKQRKQQQQTEQQNEFAKIHAAIGACMMRLDAIEARQPQTPEPKPKCERCGDTKMLTWGHDPSDGGVIKIEKLRPCVKVGDVVSTEVANMLPVGSRIQGTGWSSDAKAYWERTNNGWNGVAGGDTEPTLWSKSLNDTWMFDISWRIIRIGPAPATTDVPD